MAEQEISKLIEKCVIASSWVQPSSIVTSTPQLHKVETPGLPYKFLNGIYRTQLSNDEASEVIEKEYKSMRDRKISFRWYCYPHSSPGDLEPRLQKLNPQAVTELAGLFYSLANFEHQADPNITVEEVNASNVEEYAQTNCDAWEQTGKEAEDTKISIRTDVAKADRGYKAFLARYDREPASTGMFRLVENAGYLLGGATNPKFRKKGVYGELVRAKIAASQRSRYSTSISACPQSNFCSNSTQARI